MARGRNRADLEVRLDLVLEMAERKVSLATIVRETPCIFISHKQEDTDECRRIADYILDAGIDVYFDDYDEVLADLVAGGDPDKITGHIKDGIDFSTHMLCVVSPRTITSYWVPFEVGYGYGKTHLGVLTLKGLAYGALPEYMRTVEVVLRGAMTLNAFIARLLGKPELILERSGVIQASNARRHPLADVLEQAR